VQLNEATFEKSILFQRPNWTNTSYKL